MSKRRAFLLVFVGAGVLLTAAYLYQYTHRDSRAHAPAEVVTAMQECAAIYKNKQVPVQDMDARANECYLKVINDALNIMSAHAFLVQILATDPSGRLIQQCHQIEHVVAMEAYKRNHSIEDTIRDCSLPGCGNGCVHGAIAEHVIETLGASFDGEAVAHMDLSKVQTIGKSLCSKDSSFCHGMGHILVMQGAPLNTSIALCNRISPEKSLGNCYTGVFMEYTQAIPAFIYRSPVVGDTYHTNRAFDCEKFDGLVRRTCYLHYPMHVRVALQEQGVVRKEIHKANYAKCAEVTDRAARAECFLGIGYTDGKPDECAYAGNPRDEFYCTVGAGIYYKIPRRDRIAFCMAYESSAQRAICRAYFREIYVEATNTITASEK